MGKLYLATKNQHKVSELQQIISSDHWCVQSAISLDARIGWEETGATFVENARIKAMELRKFTCDPVLADDSGLCVDALNGAPGVYSSRFSGREGDDDANIIKLLNELKDHPDHLRTARFVCCLLFIDRDGTEHIFEGHVDGWIGREKIGKNGFGYDPVFRVGETGRSMAELSSEEKNGLSHRRMAIDKWRGVFG